MPEGNPQFGEVWTTQAIQDTGNRNVIGVVADVTDQMVTLVSLTGNRVRLPGNRLFGWRFSHAMPTNVPQCSRRGCANLGFLRYSHHDHNEYVCPRHLPMGIIAEVVRQRDEYTMNRQANPFVCNCLHCPNQDIVEDLHLNQLPVGQWGLWTCLMCGYRWAVIGSAPHGVPPQWYHDTLTEMLRQLGTHGFDVIAVETTAVIATSLPPEAHYGPGLTATTRETLPVPESAILVRLSMRTRQQAPTSQRVRPVQRLGGQPNRIGAGSGPNPQITEEAYERFYRQQDVAPSIDLHREMPIPRIRRPRPELELPEEVQEQEALVAVPDGSRWTQRASGNVIEVERVVRSQDGEAVVRYRRMTDDPINPTMSMLRRDFLQNHTPFILPDSTSPGTPLPIDVASGDEWESSNGDIIIIATVDPKREIVQAEERTSKRRRMIAFVEFTNGRWRKIVRRTAYDRLMQSDDEDL